MTIHEVSERFGVSPDTLRYYEKVGMIPPVPRTPGGKRDYGEEELKWVELAQEMGCNFVSGTAFYAVYCFFTEFCVFPLDKRTKKRYNEENQYYGVSRNAVLAFPAFSCVRGSCQINWNRKEYHL